MNERRPSFSRRKLVRYCGVGGTVGLAGCLWGGSNDDDGNGDDGDDTDNGTDADTDGNGNMEDRPLVERFELAGDGAAEFRDWLIPGNSIVFSDGTELLFQHNDYEAATEQGWSDMAQQRQNIASNFGTQAESHVGSILIGSPEGGSQPRSIHLGDFDKESVVEFQQDENWEIKEEYEGYSILTRSDITAAIGTDAMLVTPLYEEYIDAKNGDHERLGEADEGVGIVLDLLPDGVQMSVSRNPDREGVDVSGTSIMEVGSDGESQRKVRTVVFNSVDAASVDAALELVNMADDEPLAAEHHEHVVMLEYVPG
jgi:hypothetical protein